MSYVRTLLPFLSRRMYGLLLLVSLVLLGLAYQVPGAARIDVGSGADSPFLHGFSFRDRLADRDARWTTGRAEIRFWGVGNADGLLTLVLAAPRPAGAPRLTVSANGVPLQTLTPGGAFQEYRFPVSRAEIGPSGDLIVTLDGDLFQQPPDERTLGVFVDAASFTAQGLVLPAPVPALFFVALSLLTGLVGAVWANSPRAGLAAGLAAALFGAAGVAFARVPAAWFSGPLFWTLLPGFAAALGLAWGLLRIAPGLPVRRMFAVMSLAFVVRLIWASGPGYIVDMQDYVVWSYKMATYGLGTAYVPYEGLWMMDQFPGLVYITALMGHVYRLVWAPDFLYPVVAGDPALRGLTDNPAALADPMQRLALRLPYLLCDLATGALILALIWKSRPGRLAWAGALAYWFNPVVIWNGAYWGQTDAAHTLLVVLALALVQARRFGFGFLMYGLAFLLKPQAAVYGPLLLLLAWRTARWQGVWRAGLGGAAGLGLMTLPMLLSGGAAGMVDFFFSAVGHHPIVSVDAHNLWWLLFRGEIDVPDTLPVWRPVPWLSYRLASLILFGVFFLAILYRMWRADAGRRWLLASLAGFAFFMLPTEIHENYGFTALALLAVALPMNPRVIGLLFAALTVTMVLNYGLHDPGVYGWLGLHDPDRDFAAARLVNSVVSMALFFAWGACALVTETTSTPPQVVTPAAGLVS